ncbi:MAG: phosphatidylglycerophosphatase A [Rhodospirillales bacterium]|nr:phosphatidylglycerophosphatase A [Rhodospirillales bacterium]
MKQNSILPDGLGPGHPVVLLATWFGAGLLPWAPGTWGSLAALPFAWFIHDAFGVVGLAIATAGIFVIGLWAASVYVRRDGEADPGAVVIDEVAGQWLVLVAVPPDFILYGIGFVLFRIADIFKPWPASWIDRTVKGGLGVMLDDTAAALYAGVALYVLSGWMGGG